VGLAVNDAFLSFMLHTFVQNKHHHKALCTGTLLRVLDAADSKHHGDKHSPRRGRWQRVAIRAGAFWLVCVNTLQHQFLRVSAENAWITQQPEHARACVESVDQRWCYFGRILR
jgi:hypothetical protein